MMDRVYNFNTGPATVAEGAEWTTGEIAEWHSCAISTIETRKFRGTDKLYATLDASPFYLNPVDPSVRPSMNVPFLLAKPDLEKKILD